MSYVCFFQIPHPSFLTQMAEGEGDPRDLIKLTHDKLSVDTVSDSVTCPSCGAISIFIGTTRNSFEGMKVVQLEYEAYVPMAESELRKIYTDIRARWPTVRHICVHHRLGVVPVTEASVIIGISSPHRRGLSGGSAVLYRHPESHRSHMEEGMQSLIMRCMKLTSPVGKRTKSASGHNRVDL
ncbi:unnamed protein product [Coregonus sp. 'balchen']|nr:unnamed protein product [Coregonus sp. 'balchen']